MASEASELKMRLEQADASVKKAAAQVEESVASLKKRDEEVKALRSKSDQLAAELDSAKAAGAGAVRFHSPGPGLSHSWLSLILPPPNHIPPPPPIISPLTQGQRQMAVGAAIGVVVAVLAWVLTSVFRT